MIRQCSGECEGRNPIIRSSRGGLFLAAFAALLQLSCADSQNETTCTWLPWHPQAQPVIRNGSLATIVTGRPVLCPDGTSITDLYVNKTVTTTGVPSLRFLTAKCSNGQYLGWYARPSRSGPEPLSTLVAHDDVAMDGVMGVEDTTLEGLGNLNGSDASAGNGFEDQCPGNGTLSGFQIFASSGGGILQLRLLCTELGGNTSSCGAQLTQAASPLAASPGVPATFSLGPTTGFSLYIFFALQWSTVGKPPPDLVVAALKAMDPYLLASLHSTGTLCLADDQAQAHSRGANASCFEVGPLQSDSSFSLLQSLQDWIASPNFRGNLTMQGVDAPPATLMLASLSRVSTEDLGRADPSSASPAPAPASVAGHKHSSARQAGLIAGCTVLGVFLAGLAVLLLVWLRHHRRRHATAEAAKDSEKCQEAAPKKEAWNLRPPSPGSAVKVCKSVFAESSQQDQDWSVRSSWEWRWVPQAENKSAQLRAERAQRLTFGVSAPVSSNQPPRAGLGHAVWAVEPPASKQEMVSPFSIVRPPRAGGWKTGLAHDSDEAMQSTLTPNKWQQMHSQVVPPPPLLADEPVLPIAPNTSTALDWDVAKLRSGARASSGVLTRNESRLKTAPTESSLPCLDLHSRNDSLTPEPQRSGFNSSKLPPSLLAAFCTTNNTSTSGGEDVADEWEIQLSDLSICMQPNGQPVELGTGAFGTVYKALLNDVTEVAAKQLHTSSESQIALFKREIAIHKRCRSSHVVQFLGACIEPTCMTLVTELMDHSLDKDIYDLSRPFTWEEQCKDIAQDVAQALAYLHHQRVVHLDIKSRNVLLTVEGRAKLADVGLSQVMQNTYLSQLDGLGTFAYAAPELLSGGSNCSTKADIWSYGVLLHEMVTREIPQRGNLSDRQPHQCPPHVHDLINRCMERAPEERPSAKTIVKFLRADTPEQAAAVLAASVLEDGLPPSRRTSLKQPDPRKLARWASMP